MNKRRCSNQKCHVDDGETCPLGALTPDACTSWHSGGEEASPETDSSEHYEARVPWSGSALGLSDLMILLPRSRHLLIGVLGAHDAGKTTMLTANYLLMLQGNRLAEATFAGSRTLGAWESLASWMRFHDAALAPMFPPHTPRGSSRVPGLLHVALRRKSGQLRDLLLADAPGEWFSKWAIAENAAPSEGAQWLVDRSDAFIVIADCDRLRGKDRGLARAELLQLIERLGNHVGSRPTILVWTKSEFEIPPAIRESIQAAIAQNLPGATEHCVTISDPETFSEALGDIVSVAWDSPHSKPMIEAVQRHDVFFAFRGHHADS